MILYNNLLYILHSCDLLHILTQYEYIIWVIIVMIIAYYLSNSTPSPCELWANSNHVTETRANQVTWSHANNSSLEAPCVYFHFFTLTMITSLPL